MAQLKPWKWYVYELVDPRDGEVFYVGKGSGKRIEAHEKEARASQQVCTEKLNRIRDIWAAGLEVERQFVAFFREEAEAYKYEAQRIDSYGLDSLTNQVPGGERGFVGTPRPTGWTVNEAVTVLRSKPIALDWLAIYLRAKESKRGVRLSGSELQLQIGTVTLKTLMPMLWDAIKKSRKALDELRPLLRERGIDITYGCAQT